ncbi:NAD(P)H-binding protein [Lactobacillus sp. R2/2]|nr:NAD(P)H-binding protein [Lactobacillus sp. R2/2]
MNFLILAANGQIARIVENRILSEDNFQNINLTLGLRNSHRLASLGPKARIMEVDLTNNQAVYKAMYKQEIVFVDVVNHTNVIEAMKANHVSRVILPSFLVYIMMLATNLVDGITNLLCQTTDNH